MRLTQTQAFILGGLGGLLVYIALLALFIAGITNPNKPI